MPEQQQQQQQQKRMEKLNFMTTYLTSKNTSLNEKIQS